MKRISVLLVDDHTVVREGLRVLLESDGDIEIVGEVRNGREAVRMTVSLGPEIVLMDIAMPRLNGLEATRQILAQVPTAKVVLLSAHADDEYVQQATRVGAAGYVLKHASHMDLTRAIREVHKGHRYFSPAVARRFEARVERSGQSVTRSGSGIADLSRREVEVLQLIAEGQANKQVAAELGISCKTVEKHRQNLMKKLDLHDIAGLTRFAIAAGVVDGGVQIIIT
jgi:DNA-binding NarL/FixJ family response regulator